MFNPLVALALTVGLLSTPSAQPACAAPTEPIEVPILLYHHVGPTEGDQLLTVSPDDFTEQMHVLVELGYQAITPRALSDALRCGSPLPERAVIISFDDGHLDNYLHAFPVMRELGFPGVVYVVANRTASAGFLSLELLREMIDAGWEIGSHSWSHPDLRGLSDQELRTELYESRRSLEAGLGVKVDSLAYPYGSATPDIIRMAAGFGYRNAMGLGTLTTHSRGNLYYLSRRAVDGRGDLTAFLHLLNVEFQAIGFGKLHRVVGSEGVHPFDPVQDLPGHGACPF